MKYNRLCKKIEFTEEELFDKDITDAILEDDPIWLNENLGISLEKASEICEELKLYGKISIRNLKTIMFARDRMFLDIDIDKVTTVDLEKEDLEPEFEFFNNKMKEKNNSAVKVEGINSDGKRVVLYYYPCSIVKDKYNIYRQMRVYNEHDDVEAIQENVVFANGRIGSNITALAAYKYDENGNKKFGLYDDEYYGGRYFEYDENGKMRYLVLQREYRKVPPELSKKLLVAFDVDKTDFECMDNSVLQKNLKLFKGDTYKTIGKDSRNHDDR